MDEFIARENIRRFEEQLTSTIGEQQREQIKLLLDAERQRLRELRQSTNKS